MGAAAVAKGIKAGVDIYKGLSGAFGPSKKYKDNIARKDAVAPFVWKWREILGGMDGLIGPAILGVSVRKQLEDGLERIVQWWYVGDPVDIVQRTVAVDSEMSRLYNESLGSVPAVKSTVRPVAPISQASIIPGGSGNTLTIVLVLALLGGFLVMSR